jgi:hypothetical protein
MLPLLLLLLLLPYASSPPRSEVHRLFQVVQLVRLVRRPNDW